MTDKLHPLHSADFVCSVVHSTGKYPGGRATGRTTALALQFLSEATIKAGASNNKVRISDHPEGNDRALLDVIKWMYGKLFSERNTTLNNWVLVSDQPSLPAGTYIWISRK